MAHLLGHPGCMESLRADLRDLQAAIADVSSRAGAVRFPSWKFPDKVSCDLDLTALLERYSYAENDPEFTQHSHVVLLELVIDRLLLLLQSFTGYAENLLSKQAVPPAQTVGPCMSAGLTVRRYWCSMLKLGAFYQQLLAEKKACRKEIPTLQCLPQAGKPEKERLKHCLPDVLELRTSTEVAQSTSLCPSSSVRAPDSDASGSSLPRAARSMAESSRSIPTQTTGLSLEPCDTCASAQASLREVGKAIASICQSQNIPSALSRFQDTVEGTTGKMTLSATDVNYWASEQSKDLSRISKHLQMLLQQVNPLKSELEESEKQKDKLRKQVEDFSQLLQVEKETQAQQRKEAEQSLEVKNKEYLEAVARLERDKDDLRRGAALLEERFSALKEELAVKQAAVQELEVSKTTLLEEMRTTMVARSRVLELEEKVELLTSQRESLGQELSATTTQLEKEKAKVESTLRHQESLQAKQRALLQQLDSLDREREELQASLGEAEEDKARLAEQLEESQEQSRQQLRAQQELLYALQQEKLSLEQSVSELQANVSRLEEQAQELKERERLLVFFPELHVPAEMQFESTGSLTKDMEKQLQANSIRISVLEQENVRLRSALAKVKAAAEQGVLKLVPQTQLWSHLGGEASGQDAGRPSSRGSRDSRGTHGRADEARQRAPSSQRLKPLSADSTRKAGLCLSVPAEGLVLNPAEPRGRGRPCPPSSHHAGGYRK
ncbi:coiled-coil domain-containing protein 157 isoform X2 [Aquila chrysaetos chrysaetos]|uniref:coiled-coil domain-containing protein 157 isoform X2 n=1 Tax=Aquila chrysaetos chrysaetos TaxID=223781 RepID=UPI0011773095|nr:coiled-coil domain-containing protein 157 isoform X2 [Aquila chrysaetos chrysaetos]